MKHVTNGGNMTTKSAKQVLTPCFIKCYVSVITITGTLAVAILLAIYPVSQVNAATFADLTFSDPAVANAAGAVEQEIIALETPLVRAAASGTIGTLLINSGDLICAAWIINADRQMKTFAIRSISGGDEAAILLSKVQQLRDAVAGACDDSKQIIHKIPVCSSVENEPIVKPKPVDNSPCAKEWAAFQEALKKRDSFRAQYGNERQLNERILKGMRSVENSNAVKTATNIEASQMDILREGAIKRMNKARRRLRVLKRYNTIVLKRAQAYKACISKHSLYDRHQPKENDYARQPWMYQSPLPLREYQGYSNGTGGAAFRLAAYEPARQGAAFSRLLYGGQGHNPVVYRQPPKYFSSAMLGHKQPNGLLRHAMLYARSENNGGIMLASAADSGNSAVSRNDNPGGGLKKNSPNVSYKYVYIGPDAKGADIAFFSEKEIHAFKFIRPTRYQPSCSACKQATDRINQLIDGHMQQSKKIRSLMTEYNQQMSLAAGGKRNKSTRDKKGKVHTKFLDEPSYNTQLLNDQRFLSSDRVQKIMESRRKNTIETTRIHIEKAQKIQEKICMLAGDYFKWEEDFKQQKKAITKCEKKYCGGNDFMPFLGDDISNPPLPAPSASICPQCGTPLYYYQRGEGDKLYRYQKKLFEIAQELAGGQERLKNDSLSVDERDGQIIHRDSLLVSLERQKAKVRNQAIVVNQRKKEIDLCVKEKCSSGPNDQACSYGVSDVGTCLPKPKDKTKGGAGFLQFFGDLFLPHGIEGELTKTVPQPDHGSFTGETEFEIVQVIHRDGNDPFDTTDPIKDGDTTGRPSTSGGTTSGGFDFSQITGASGATGTNCGANGSTSVSLTGSTLTLNPFFTNGATTFTVSGNVATSTSNNLTLLSTPGHTCTVTPTGVGTAFVLKCTNNSTGGTCSDTWK